MPLPAQQVRGRRAAHYGRSCLSGYTSMPVQVTSSDSTRLEQTAVPWIAFGAMARLALEALDADASKTGRKRRQRPKPQRLALARPAADVHSGAVNYWGRRACRLRE